MRTKAEIMANRKGGPIPHLSYLAEHGRKKCKECQEVKSTNAFFKNSRSFDLLDSKCRICNSKRIQKYKVPGYNSENCKRYKKKQRKTSST